MKHIFTSMALLIAKINKWIWIWRTHVWLAKNKCTTCHCLARILGRRHHRIIFFWERGWSRSNWCSISWQDTQFFLPKLDDIDVADMWFQQDDATCHTANETIQLPHETFPGRVLSRFADQNWPPRSCDLTPLDFFLLLFELKGLCRQSHNHTCIPRGN